MNATTSLASRVLSGIGRVFVRRSYFKAGVLGLAASIGIASDYLPTEIGFTHPKEQKKGSLIMEIKNPARTNAGLEPTAATDIDIDDLVKSGKPLSKEIVATVENDWAWYLTSSTGYDYLLLRYGTSAEKKQIGMMEKEERDNLISKIFGRILLGNGSKEESLRMAILAKQARYFFGPPSDVVGDVAGLGRHSRWDWKYWNFGRWAINLEGPMCYSVYENNITPTVASGKLSDYIQKLIRDYKNSLARRAHYPDLEVGMGYYVESPSSPYQAGDFDMEGFKKDYETHKEEGASVYKLLKKNGITSYATAAQLTVEFNKLIKIPNLEQLIDDEEDISSALSSKADAQTIIKNKQLLTNICPLTLGKSHYGGGEKLSELKCIADMFYPCFMAMAQDSNSISGRLAREISQIARYTDIFYFRLNELLKEDEGGSSSQPMRLYAQQLLQFKTSNISLAGNGEVDGFDLEIFKLPDNAASARFYLIDIDGKEYLQACADGQERCNISLGSNKFRMSLPDATDVNSYRAYLKYYDGRGTYIGKSRRFLVFTPR